MFSPMLMLPSLFGADACLLMAGGPSACSADTLGVRDFAGTLRHPLEPGEHYIAGY